MYPINASLLANMLLLSDYAMAFNEHNLLVQKEIAPLLDKHSPGMTLKKLVGGMVDDETKRIAECQERLKATLCDIDTDINFKNSIGHAACEYLNRFKDEDTSPKIALSKVEYDAFFEQFLFLTKQMAERFVLCQVDMRCKLHFDRKLPEKMEHTMKRVGGTMPTGNADSSERQLKTFFEAAEHPNVRNICYQVYKEATKEYFVDF
jgi:hypothetical protein